MDQVKLPSGAKLRKWFEEERDRAEDRDIPFKLSFKQWMSIWKPHLMRGPYERYRLTRVSNRGDFAVGNVMIKMVETVRGGKGVPRPEEVRRKISESMKGIKRTPEHKRKISRSLTGTEHTPEHNANISKALKGRKQNAARKRATSEAMKKWWAARKRAAKVIKFPKKAKRR